MRKTILLIFIIFLYFCNIDIIFANERLNVTLNKCVDGDTAYFNLNDDVIKTRFLAINTPESTNKKEPYGKEASTLTCNLLTNAKLLQIEYDKNSDKKDKYDRDLVWVWVDNKLIQETLIKEGLAEVKYIYGDYKYTDNLFVLEKEAKKKKINMWTDYQDKSNNKYEEDIYIYITLIAILIINYLKRKYKIKRI